MKSHKESGARFVASAKLPAAIVGALLSSTTCVAADAERSFEVYGFAQADYIQDIGGRLDKSWDDAFRPSKICLDGACGGDGQSSISVKQSRFGVKGALPTGASGTPLNFKFEFDLFGTGVDAGQTTFRLRHAYGEWGSFLAGQTNSLFMDGDTFPNTIDYWGPTGMVFYRNVQVRWTPFKTDTSHFAIAIERPGNDVDAGNLRLIEGLEDVQVQNNEELPDLTAQYRFGGDWGHLQFAGILRKVGFETRVDPSSEWNISMVVVIFAMIELIVLPGLYTAFVPDQPIVNGAALGMTVKTDGADAAAGALLDELMIARHLQLTGEQWQEGWILSASLLTKIWIDVFIGVWAFLLAIVWIRKVEKREGAVRVSAMEIWFRFPKFVLGYFLAWFAYLAIAWSFPESAPALDQGTAVLQSPMRTMLFMLTFVAMGAITDFSKLKGMGRVAFLYGLALVVVIAPIAYVVAYLFHRGLAPPLAP